MASVVKNALKAIRERGIGTFLRELKEEGYLRCLPDGNLLLTEMNSKEYLEQHAAMLAEKQISQEDGNEDVLLA